jgi:hypothetical protein
VGVRLGGWKIRPQPERRLERSNRLSIQAGVQLHDPDVVVFGRAIACRHQFLARLLDITRSRVCQRQVVPGWYAVAGMSDVTDPSPVTARYMARGEIDPVPPYSRGRTPVVVPRYPDV